MNRVILIGRLVADPEQRFTQSGVAVANFRLAVDRKFKNADGEKETDFINCVAWRKTAELVSQYLAKGRRVGIEGSLQIRQYEDKEGNKRTAAEVLTDTNSVEFLDSGNGQGAASSGNHGAPSGAGNAPDDDDLPF